MNTELVLKLLKSYIRNGAVTFADFDKVFYFVNAKERAMLLEALRENNIRVVESSELINKDIEPRANEIHDETSAVPNPHYSKTVIREKIKLSNPALIRLIQEGNEQAVQDLCIKNRGLVDKYASMYAHYAGNRLPYEDIHQAGMLGLIKAAKKFDLSLGYEFSTYATHWITQAIRREIQDHGFVIRIPVHMMERIIKVVHIINRLELIDMSMDERIQHVSQEAELTEEQVRECLLYRSNFLSAASLNVPIGEEEEMELIEYVPATPERGQKSVEDECMEIFLREEVAEVLETLTDKERDILIKRFGIDGGIPMTLEQVGKNYGVTRERIRQVEEKALQKLRKSRRVKGLKDYYLEE